VVHFRKRTRAVIIIVLATAD